MSHYHINIFFSEEDGGYIADIPDSIPAQPLALHRKMPSPKWSVQKQAGWMPRNVREGRSLRPVISRLSIRWHGNPKRGQRGEGYRVK